MNYDINCDQDAGVNIDTSIPVITSDSKWGMRTL